MTSPSAGQYPLARYSVTLAHDWEQYEAVFATPGEARRWVREQLTYPADMSAAPPDTQFRVSIIDTLSLPHLSPVIYDWTGVTDSVLRALGDSWSSVVVPEIVSGERIFDAAAVVPELVELYASVTAESVRIPGDPVLEAKRRGLREDLAMTVDGLPERDRRVAVDRIALADLAPLIRREGPVTAILEAQAADAGTSPGQPGRHAPFELIAQHAFDSPRHAREWLRLRSRLQPEARVLRAKLIRDNGDGSGTTSTFRVGAAADMARELDVVTAFEGTVITGVAGVDRLRLIELVTRYQVLASEPPQFRLIDLGIGVPAITIQVMSPQASALGMEIAVMLDHPSLSDQTQTMKNSLRAVDQALRRHRDAAFNSARVASSGFVGADVQIALRQLHTLHSDRLRSADLSQPTVIEARIRELETRVHALLEHPSLTASDRVAVFENMARARSTPGTGYEAVFAMPSLTALANRVEQSNRAPFAGQPGQRGRDVEDALRLYQLIRVVGEGAHPRDQRRFSETRHWLRQHVTERIQRHPHLLPGERSVATSLVVGLGHNPFTQLPTRRADYRPAPVPAEQMLAPAPDTADNYHIAFLDPADPDRHLVVGTEDGQWAVREYRPYPGYPEFRLATAAAIVPEGTDIVAALRNGMVHTNEFGIQHRMTAVEVPQAVADRVNQLRTLRSQLTKSQTASPPTAPPKAAPMNPAHRRDAARPKGPGPQGPSPKRRRLG